MVPIGFDIRYCQVAKVPITIQWLNYFSHEWVERMGGEKKFQEVPDGEVSWMQHGLIYIMQREPFTYENPDHVARQRRLHEYFELARLHAEFPIHDVPEV